MTQSPGRHAARTPGASGGLNTQRAHQAARENSVRYPDTEHGPRGDARSVSLQVGVVDRDGPAVVPSPSVSLGLERLAVVARPAIVPREHEARVPDVLAILRLGHR